MPNLAKAGGLIARAKVHAPWAGALAWTCPESCSLVPGEAPALWGRGGAASSGVPPGPWGGLCLSGAPIGGPWWSGASSGAALGSCLGCRRTGGPVAWLGPLRLVRCVLLEFSPRVSEERHPVGATSSGGPAGRAPGGWAATGFAEALETRWLAPAKAGGPIARAKVLAPWAGALAWSGPAVPPGPFGVFAVWAASRGAQSGPSGGLDLV